MTLTKKIALCAIFSLAFLATANFALGDVVTFNTTLPTPGVYVGTGNSPDNWATSTNGGVTVGLTIIQRFVGPIVPTGETNAPDDTYLVTPGSGPLSAQDFGLDIYDPDGLNPLGASLTMTDVTTGQTFTFDPLLELPDNGYLQSGGGTATGTYAAEGMGAIGAQNYENPGFFGTSFPYNNSTMGGDTFEYTLSYQSSDSGADPSIAVFQANAATFTSTPEPKTMIPLAFAGIGIAFLARRRQRTARETMRS